MLDPVKDNQIGDAADSLLAIKQVEALIVTKFDEITAVYEKANGEIAQLGVVNINTLGAIEKLRTDYDDLFDRLQAVEQKDAHVIQAVGGVDIGKQFIDSDAFKALAEGSASRARVEFKGDIFKTAIVNATGQNQPLVPSDRLAGIATTPNRNLRIRDVLVATPTNSNLVEFTRESSFTNNAGPQIANSPEEYENVTKPESAIAFTLVNEPVSTLAHFIPASKQVLSDSASLHSHINMRLMYGLKLKEETQLLNGSGSNHELNGLITQATAFTVESPTQTNKLDIIRNAIKQAHVGEYLPDFLVMNPVDWYEIDIMKVGSSDDRYVVGNPRDMTEPGLWGLPVVVSNSITAAAFLIGSSQGAEIKDREQAAVEMSFEDSTNFQKNMVTLRAEERLALLVYRTEAFITGAF